MGKEKNTQTNLGLCSFFLIFLVLLTFFISDLSGNSTGIPCFTALHRYCVCVCVF